MKKLFLPLLLAFSIGAMAQGAPDLTPEQRLERVRTIYKGPLLAKAKLSESQADKVVAIIAETQAKMSPIMTDQSLSADAKMKKFEELREERDTKFKDIPLTDTEIKAVSDVLDEIRKNMQSNSRPRNN
jgi:hypothetical protein